jgi:hypothetical protein
MTNEKFSMTNSQFRLSALAGLLSRWDTAANPPRNSAITIFVSSCSKVLAVALRR